jgi:hypothetical protein
LKEGDSGSKEAQTQGEEKESCSDEEKKSKENIDAEGEQSTKTGMTMKAHSGRRIIGTITSSEHELHYPEIIQFSSTAAQSISPRCIIILSCCLFSTVIFYIYLYSSFKLNTLFITFCLSSSL